MEGFELLQNFVSTDEDLEGTMKVEPEGRRQHRKSGRSEGSEAGLGMIRTIKDQDQKEPRCGRELLLLILIPKVIVGDHY
jgi:hypothetical protein